MTTAKTARRSTPRLRRALTLLALLVAMVALTPASPAAAHAFMVASNPADGSVLSSAPGDLRLQFSEHVALEATRIDIVDGSGRHYQPGSLRLIGGTGTGTETPTAVIAALPHLAKSTYRVSWETLSSDDLHRTSGILVFGIATPVRPAPLTEALPNAAESVLRWLVFLGLAVAFGAAFCARLWRRQGAPAAGMVETCERWSAGGAAAGALVSAALLAEQLASAGAASSSRLLLGAYGQRWFLRETGFLLLFLVGLNAFRRPRDRARWSAVRVFGAAAVCLGTALLGHSAAGGALSVTRTCADALHLAAAGVWVGALVVFALLGLPRMRASRGPHASLPDALRAFCWPAVVCVATMAVTGLYLASDVVGSVDAAILTFYGRTLLLKLTLVVVAGGLGLTHALRLRRGSIRLTPRRTVRLEAGAAVAILLLAGILTSSQPATEPQLVRRPAVRTVPAISGQAGELQESLALQPNRPGRNVALVGIFDTRRPAPGPVTSVTITVLPDAGSPIAAVGEKLADGRWSAPLQLASPGRTRVVVTAHRAGMRDLTSSYSWTVGEAAAASTAATVSRAPIAGVLRTVSAGLALALLTAATLWLRWRRRKVTAADMVETGVVPEQPSAEPLPVAASASGQRGSC